MKNVRREWILLVCPIGGVAPALLLMLVRTGSVPLALLLGLAQRVCVGRGRHCGSRSPTIPDSHRHWHIFLAFPFICTYTSTVNHKSHENDPPPSPPPFPPHAL
jgi:hypothetical protein